MDTAKIFMNGKSQAVRLPKSFRFDTDEVFITKKNNSVVLTPKPSSWEDFFAAKENFPDDFLAERPDNTTPQKRESIDEDL